MPNYEPQLDLPHLVGESIALLRLHEPPEGYYFADGGGKDSCVCRHLLQASGCRFEAHYHLGIDPPELVRFVREYHTDTIRDRPKVHIFQDIKRRGMPWACARWCCRNIKEQHGRGRVKVLGVRKAESPRRKLSWESWDDLTCIACPIVHWQDDHVWQYIHERAIPYCCLYDEGWKRLGCVGCPLLSLKSREPGFARWPRYERAWARAIIGLWLSRDQAWRDGQREKQGWTGPQDHWDWWRNDAHGKVRQDAVCGDTLERFQQ